MRGKKTVVGLGTVALGLLASTVSARANFNDVGPLADVLAIRSYFSVKPHVSEIGQVVVDGDWARVTIVGKGVALAVFHRSAGRWAASDPSGPTIPSHVTAFFKKIDAETGTSEAAL